MLASLVGRWVRGLRGLRADAEAKQLINRFIAANLAEHRDFQLLARDPFGILSQLYGDDNFADILQRGFSSDVLPLLRRLAAVEIGGQVALDVGANRGVASVFLARRFAVVHAFEPATVNQERFRATMALNRVDNVTLHPLAVSDGTGRATLHLLRGHGHHSLAPVSSSPKVGEEQVQTTTLDAFLSRLGVTRVDFLKVDVEGFELEVLRGAKDALQRRQIAMIAFELAPSLLAERGIAPASIVTFLEAHGFSCHDLQGTKVGGTTPLPHGDYLAILNPDAPLPS